MAVCLKPSGGYSKVACIMEKTIDPLGLAAEEFFKRFRGESLTFDDLCVLQPRTIDFGVQEVDLSSRITRNIRISTPLVASPMEDISEYELAIAVALQGFPAVIHYNMTIQEQADQVRKVKRFENGFVKDPITLGPGSSPSCRSVTDVSWVATNRGSSPPRFPGSHLHLYHWRKSEHPSRT